MSQIDKLNSIVDLKKRFAALKSLAHGLEGEPEARSLCRELRAYFHQTEGPLNWRKACLKTSVFLINKHKLKFTDSFNTDSESRFITELDHCASNKEQFLLIKSHIKSISKSQTNILRWIDNNKNDEVLAKVYTKFKPLIESLPISVNSEKLPEEFVSNQESDDSTATADVSEVPETTEIPSFVDIPTPDEDIVNVSASQDNTQHSNTQTSTVESADDIPEPDFIDVPEVPELPSTDGAQSSAQEPEISPHEPIPNEIAEEDMQEPSDSLPDIPDVPDLPDEEDFQDSSSDNLPAQFQSGNDPIDEEESDRSTFDPVHGRKKIIGADLPKPESPGASWAALILLILPFALLFQAYQAAESQSFLSFIVIYFFGCTVIQSLIFAQKFLAGSKPDVTWAHCFVPTMPLYHKTNLGNPVCPQPLAIICSVMIVLALYAQPKLMALHKKNMIAAAAKIEEKPKQIKKVITAAVVKSKNRNVAKRKKQKARKRRKKMAKNSPPPLPEVNYADVQQEYMDRSDEIINAVYQYRLATLRKNSKAMSELAYMHDAAEGVKEDRVLAYTWYSLAIKHGDSDAQTDADSMKSQLTPEQLKKVEEYLKMDLKKIPFNPTD